MKKINFPCTFENDFYPTENQKVLSHVRWCEAKKVERQKSVSVTVIVKTTTAVIAVVLCVYCNY